MIIYSLTNVVNGKVYIGQTIQPIHRRLLTHRLAARRGSKNAIACAIRKYGADKFTVCIIEACETIDDLNLAEIRWINVMRSLAPSGYNLRTGGGEKYKLTEQFRDKLRGKRWAFHSDEFKERQRDRFKGVPRPAYHVENITAQARARVPNMTMERAREIRTYRANTGCTYREVAAHFGISLGQAGHILANETWKE